MQMWIRLLSQENIPQLDYYGSWVYFITIIFIWCFRSFPIDWLLSCRCFVDTLVMPHEGDHSSHLGGGLGNNYQLSKYGQLLWSHHPATCIVSSGSLLPSVLQVVAKNIMSCNALWEAHEVRPQNNWLWNRWKRQKRQIFELPDVLYT